MSNFLRTIGVIVLAVSWLWTPISFTGECTQQGVFITDVAKGHLNAWAKMARARKEFANCDEGGVAEGFSDTVARQSLVIGRESLNWFR